jgi:hypothetical protein
MASNTAKHKKCFEGASKNKKKLVHYSLYNYLRVIKRFFGVHYFWLYRPKDL